MRTTYYMIPIFFCTVILPSSGSWHQNSFKTCSHKIGDCGHNIWGLLLTNDHEDGHKQKSGRPKLGSYSYCA